MNIECVLVRLLGEGGYLAFALSYTCDKVMYVYKHSKSSNWLKLYWQFFVYFNTLTQHFVWPNPHLSQRAESWGGPTAPSSCFLDFLFQVPLTSEMYLYMYLRFCHKLQQMVTYTARTVIHFYNAATSDCNWQKQLSLRAFI